jgi:F-type H+-transporting ATPase subunit delta
MTSSISRNYARAIFELASAAGTRDAVELDLQAAREALHDNREVRIFLGSRLAGRTAKKALIDAGFSGRVDPQALTLLHLLVDRGRTGLVAEIVEEYQRLCRLARGVRKVTLSSAFPLEEAETEQVRRALEKAYAARVELDAQVVPELIGGVSAVSEGQEIELTIESALRSLRAGMAQQR